MGLVPKTGQAKAFEGAPINATNFADVNSIQGAIKGTIDTPADAIKNMSTLAGLAKLDMFDPKRVTLPVDMATFRGYPKITYTITNEYISVISGKVKNRIKILGNNKIGYDLLVYLEFINIVGFVPSSIEVTGANYIGNNIVEVSKTGAFITGDDFIEIDVDEDASDSADLKLENAPSSHPFYIGTPHTVPIYFQAPIIYDYSYAIAWVSAGSTFPTCPTEDPAYTPYTTRYSDSSAIQTNMKLYTTNRANSSVLAEGIYVFGTWNDLQMQYLRVDSTGTVTAIQVCDTVAPE